MSDIAIDASGLGKCYRIPDHRPAYRTLRDVLTGTCAAPMRRLWNVARGRTPANTHRDENVWALRDVSLEVRQGEVLGVIGRNGSGKSTMLKILSRITSPTTGVARVRGRVGSLLEVGTGFHGELSGRDNVYLSGAMLGMKRREIERTFDEIVEFSQIGRFLDTPVKHYSSGMYMRLAFSVAAHLQSEILLVDEVLAVGDFDFQKKCTDKMRDLTRTGKTVLFVSHSMSSIETLCRRAILLSKGTLQAVGNPADVIKHYLPQEKTGSNTEVRWESPQSAPGNDYVSLAKVSTHTADGQLAAQFDISEEILFRIAYRTQKPGLPCLVRIMLRDQSGAWVLSACNQYPGQGDETTVSNTVCPAGLFETRCVIPGNLLNNQTYSISVEVHPQLEGMRVPEAVRCDNVLSFTVNDPQAERFRQHHAFLGPVRPKVRWDTDWKEAA
jgi:lipopolysaccharide transport system ATP-binding protein